MIGRTLKPGLVSLALVAASLGMSTAVGAAPASAAQWVDCGGGPHMTFMAVKAKGIPCSSAWILGEEALAAWDGFSNSVRVRGFKCKMNSGYPYHAAVTGDCKRGGKGAKFATGD